ncbi:conserved protein of unknown function [Candidatus Nitrotoga arctica]|uniref:Uncharacterized protein n=1 Tax=Candidatus Nitrotoga arctica TaxID=453162 RepID=A0ABN8AFX7_9PROT|nr:conserved protein of unknown function [Candidatus Nitrotoga arctica]
MSTLEAKVANEGMYSVMRKLPHLNASMRMMWPAVKLERLIRATWVRKIPST